MAARAPLRQERLPGRVSGLPHAHLIEHATGACEDHLDFRIWALSFFVGRRLTPTEAGFLDTTPLKPGKLVDCHRAQRESHPCDRIGPALLAENPLEPAPGKALRGGCPRLLPCPAPAESGVRETCGTSMLRWALATG